MEHPHFTPQTALILVLQLGATASVQKSETDFCQLPLAELPSAMETGEPLDRNDGIPWKDDSPANTSILLMARVFPHHFKHHLILKLKIL